MKIEVQYIDEFEKAQRELLDLKKRGIDNE